MVSLEPLDIFIVMLTVTCIFFRTFISFHIMRVQLFVFIFVSVFFFFFFLLLNVSLECYIERESKNFNTLYLGKEDPYLRSQGLYRHRLLWCFLCLCGHIRCPNDKQLDRCLLLAVKQKVRVYTREKRHVQRKNVL